MKWMKTKGHIAEAVTHMLPDSWYRIDKFEGSAYKRILIPVIGAIRSQGIFLANIYVANHH